MPATVRHHLSFDNHNTRCLVYEDMQLTRRLSAFELTAVKKLTKRQINYQINVIDTLNTVRSFKEVKEGADERDFKRLYPVRQLLLGECCYAFSSKSTGLIKIGRTIDIFSRWSKLECSGGKPLQLLTVWKTGTSKLLEAEMHARFSDHRRLGEWFDAEPVFNWIKGNYNGT